MKKILITGVARGLGKHLANFFVEKGCQVFGTSRSFPTDAQSKNVEILPLDLTFPKSIDQLARQIQHKTSYLDVIVHNAGVAYLDPADVIEEEEARYIFDVNFFGPIHLTKKLLPLLKAAPQSNLIFISSIVSIDHWPYLGVYSASKAAIESVAFEWGVLLKHWNIYTSVVRSNPIPTDMQILRSKNTQNSTYPPLGKRKLDWESIDGVCATIFEIINSSSPSFAYETGEYSKKTADHFINKTAYEEALRNYQIGFL